jgi:ATPase family associated with various cellular activities (AAA)
MTSNIHGNSTFTVSVELAQAFMDFTGYESVFHETDPAEYDNAKAFPYPLKKDLYSCVNFLDYMDCFTDAEIERLSKQVGIADEYGNIAYKQEDFDLITSFRTSLLDYMKACSLRWQLDASVTEIPFDWLYSYLKSLQTNEDFAFISEDEFGNTISPIQITKVKWSEGGIMSSTGINICYNTFHAYSSEKVMKLNHYLTVPFYPTVNFETVCFLRNQSTQVLTERNEGLLTLLGKSCDSVAKIPGTANRTKHMQMGFRGLVPVNTSGRYLFHPETTEEHFAMYSNLGSDCTLEIKDIKGYQTWWLSRIVTAWHLQTRTGVLIAGDWLFSTVYDRTAINNLFLKPETKTNIASLCYVTKQGTAYKDPFRHQASNLALLQGVPGTGKTSSIMKISDHFETPLIHVSIADCDYGDLSYYLDKILQLAQVFGAFVLVDEADALIYERSVEDMSRTQIVTKVLKTFESFSGLVFLTSNVDPDKVDPAIRSRLTLQVQFPNPSFEQIKTVWKKNLENINYKVDEAELDEVVQICEDKSIDLRAVMKRVSMVKAYVDYAQVEDLAARPLVSFL